MQIRPYVQRSVSLKGQTLANVRQHLPVGSWFLVSATTGAPVYSVLSFIVHLLLPKRVGKNVVKPVSPETFKARIYDLKEYCDFLDSCGSTVEEATDDILRRYLGHMVAKTSSRGTPFSPKTIRRRLDTIGGLYKHLLDTGQIPHALALPRGYDAQQEEPDGESIETAYLDLANDPDGEVRAIPLYELRLILDSFGLLPDDLTDIREARPTVSRNRVMFEFCLQAGLRRAEVCYLQLSNVLKAAKAVRSPLEKYPLRVWGKGAKWRTVEVPGWLLLLAQLYAENSRARIVAERKAYDSAYRAHDYLFVQEQPNPALKGDRIRPGYLSTLFARHAATALRQDIDLQHPSLPRRAYTVHQLRHTYAVHTYFVRRQLGDSEPWVYIQHQLGHESVETTTRIYLQITGQYEREAGDLWCSILGGM